MPKYLESLWITHVRCLGQALHETFQDRNISSIPPEIIQQARVGVKVMLSNMVNHAGVSLAKPFADPTPF
jgi:hypothetical protein